MKNAKLDVAKLLTRKSITDSAYEVSKGYDLFPSVGRKALQSMLGCLSLQFLKSFGKRLDK